MITLARFFFFFNDTATTEIYTLSLHDALPISACQGLRQVRPAACMALRTIGARLAAPGAGRLTRLPRSAPHGYSCRPRHPAIGPVAVVARPPDAAPRTPDGGRRHGGPGLHARPAAGAAARGHGRVPHAGLSAGAGRLGAGPAADAGRLHRAARRPLGAGRRGPARGLEAAPARPAAHRSEERRVGKECRSRWSPY